MLSGIVFDIKQMALFDGPGIRTTVFLKGCPLRCVWCHNPEGFSTVPQMMTPKNGLPRLCGVEYTSESLAKLLLRDKDFLAKNGGGVTFSGGEPLLQCDFVAETRKMLGKMHCAAETCGYAERNVFERLIDAMDYIIMDIKIADDEKHKRYTGIGNSGILSNLEVLKQSGKPFLVRVPVIPGVNDSDDDFERMAELLVGTDVVGIDVELLPYHKTAGAKYAMIGEKYTPPFDEWQEPRLETEIFTRRGVRCRII